MCAFKKCVFNKRLFSVEIFTHCTLQNNENTGEIYGAVKKINYDSFFTQFILIPVRPASTTVMSKCKSY